MSARRVRIRRKRVYETPDAKDGFRILVDRVWPRGVSKQAAKVDLWLKDIAPSTGLRKWFAHDAEKWQEFRRRYEAELERNDEQVAALREEAAKGPVTLVYGARDTEHNEALVLKDFLDG